MSGYAISQLEVMTYVPQVDLKFVLGEGKTLESTNTDIHDSGNNMTDNYSLSCQSTDLEVLSCSYTVHVVSTSSQ